MDVGFGSHDVTKCSGCQGRRVGYAIAVTKHETFMYIVRLSIEVPLTYRQPMGPASDYVKLLFTSPPLSIHKCEVYFRHVVLAITRQKTHAQRLHDCNINQLKCSEVECGVSRLPRDE